MNTNLTINTSKIRGYKNALYAISLILIFAVGIVMAFAPTTSAQVGETNPRQTYGYITVAPFLIGVGQTATVNAWVVPLPQIYEKFPAYPLGFSGISVTFTKPDGTTDTFTPTDATGQYPAGVVEAGGLMYFYYTPNMAGNWSVTMTMPAQNFTDSAGTVQYTACTSQPTHFTVQTAAVNAGLLNGWPYAPLPTGYWTYPINSNNREWGLIIGDWDQSISSHSPAIPNAGLFYQPYGSAPSTAHILWDTQVYPAGIVGGVFGDLSYYVGISGNPAVIMDGKEYINIPTGNTFKCFELTTGKLDYTATGQVTAGYEAPGNTFVQSASYGVPENVQLAATYGKTPTPYLFQNAGTTWNYYAPLTGAIVRSITNVSASSFDFFEGSAMAFGETYLNVNSTTHAYATNFVWGWNLTKVVNNDWYTGLVWMHNLNSPGHPGINDGADRSCFTVSSDMKTVVVGAGTGDNLVAGFDCITGTWLWNDTLPYISIALNTQVYNSTDFIASDAHGTFYCYSDLTGALLWSTLVGSPPWNSKETYVTTDNNNLYVAVPDGTVSAVNLVTGQEVWTSTPIPSTEFVTNAIPAFEFSCVAGGYVYTYLGDALGYQINPNARFAETICLNATTGATVWTLNGAVCPTGEADGYLTGVGIFNGYLYTVGKGQTSTSVSVQNDAIAQGAAVLIKGNVLDQSPAQPGTPAVSDASQSEWMDYLNMQNATLLNSPPTPQGVQVTLTAVDPNNNIIIIGTTTTDAAGNYYYNYVPPITGIYKITATFMGTNSYWSSTSETGVTVTATPTTTSGTSTTTTSTGVSATELYTIGAAIIIVIIISVAVAILVLRKRP